MSPFMFPIYGRLRVNAAFPRKLETLFCRMAGGVRSDDGARATCTAPSEPRQEVYGAGRKSTRKRKEITGRGQTRKGEHPSPVKIYESCPTRLFNYASIQRRRLLVVRAKPELLLRTGRADGFLIYRERVFIGRARPDLFL